MVDCYTAAMRILGYRFNSEEELRRKLKRKNYDSDDIEATMLRLRAEAWLDDQRFAGAFVRAQARRKVGRRRIEHELQAAGVDGEFITQALETNIDPDREKNTVAALAAKRFGALVLRHGHAVASSRENRQKIAAFLIRKGFDTTVVLDVVKRLR